MSESQIKEQKKQVTQRTDRLKQIDALYRSQLKKIHSEGKQKVTIPDQTDKNSLKIESQTKKVNGETKNIDTETKKLDLKLNDNLIRVKSSGSFLNTRTIQSSRLLGNGDTERDIVRVSTFFRGDTTKNLQLLRRENETKQLRIRELTNKCEGLIDKLKRFVPSEQLQGELDTLKDATSDRTQRLERLFKIKTDEIFFKMKLQVVSLLQEFGVPREKLSQSNEIKNETELFGYLARQLKGRLKDFRTRQAQNNFSLQKDRIVNQKQEERIHFLTETNQLLKLSENKLKGKIEDLKGQLAEYIERLRTREQEHEERQSQYFRLKKQNEELHITNQKLSHAIKGTEGQKKEERRNWEARQKELKQLLSNYHVQKQKLGAELEEAHGQIEEQLIRMKFLEQENERMNREIIRWKERFEGLEKQKSTKIRELEEEKSILSNSFQDYKLTHNEGADIEARNEIQEALRKVEEYQVAYQEVLQQLEDERRLLRLSEEQNEEKLENQERQWLGRVKRVEQSKEIELDSFRRESEGKITEMKQQFQKKELLLVEELQAKLKAQLAERDKRNTQHLIAIENQNDDLRREIDSLNKMLQVKDSLINVLNNKRIPISQRQRP